MCKYVVEISDKNRTSLKVVVELPIVGEDRWSVLDKGIWACNSGVAKIIDKTNYKIAKKEIVPHKHLNLCNAEKTNWAGVTLWDFQGLADVNQCGSGVMPEGWSLKFEFNYPHKASVISWRVVG